MSFLQKVQSHYEIVATKTKIPTFATENDTDFWVVVVDDFFGIFKTKNEAKDVYEMIGGEDGDDGLAETPFGASQLMPPRYKPKNVLDKNWEPEAKISDFKPIDIKSYIQKTYKRDKYRLWKKHHSQPKPAIKRLGDEREMRNLFKE